MESEMSKSKSKRDYARKKWCEQFNYFYADKTSKWKYEEFKNKSSKEITLETIAFLLKAGEIIDRKSNPIEVFGSRGGKKYSRGTRMHRTYIYRAAVEQKIYDGQSRWNNLGKKPTGTGNWKVLDKAIDNWNEEFSGTKLEIGNSKLEQAKSGRREQSPADILASIRNNVFGKEEIEDNQLEIFPDKE